MSFILDALRKSESERQRETAPGIATTRYRVSTRRGARWLPWIVVVLAANAVLLAFLLLRGPAGDDRAEPIARAAGPAVTPTLAETPAAARPSQGVRPLATEVAESAAVGQQTAVSKPPSVAARAQTRSAASDNFDTAATSPGPQLPASVPTGGGLPRMQDLILSGELVLPPLRIDIHVFSDTPSQRFVFINMNKYREGDKLKEGPTVEAINPTGVVLAQQGKRFTLDRE
jgi:general secretion pathway protein B